MHLLFSVGNTPVIVLPMENECAAGSRNYFSRGWCFLEFSLALSFENIANAGIHARARELCDLAKREGSHTVSGFREALRRKSFTYNKDADVVSDLFLKAVKMNSQTHSDAQSHAGMTAIDFINKEHADHRAIAVLLRADERTKDDVKNINLTRFDFTMSTDVL